MSAMWQRLVALGFRLLYNELACLYDPVSWAVSLGRWRGWRQSARRFLPAQGSVLEVGCGPGHLLAELARDGYQTVGLDLSRSMVQIARRRIQRQRLDVGLCRGHASALPWAGETFDAVVATFPTSYVYDPVWCAGVARVLRPGGRVIVVETASLERGIPLAGPVDLIARITAPSAPGPDLCRLLDRAGLAARREMVDVDRSKVRLVVAHKKA
jgi:ubiquinone/menaquinone biosynthesis C-methylase UbiE